MRSVESIKGIPSGEYNEILLSPQKEIIRKYDLTNEWADYRWTCHVLPHKACELWLKEEGMICTNSSNQL